MVYVWLKVQLNCLFANSNLLVPLKQCSTEVGGNGGLKGFVTNVPIVIQAEKAEPAIHPDTAPFKGN